MSLFIQESPGGLLFKVYIQPRSARNMITGLHGDALKIKLTAPPVAGAANKMCVEYLAKCLKVPKSTLEILSGQTGRTKRVLFRWKDNQVPKTKEECLRSIKSLLEF